MSEDDVLKVPVVVDEPTKNIGEPNVEHLWSIQYGFHKGKIESVLVKGMSMEQALGTHLDSLEGRNPPLRTDQIIWLKIVYQGFVK